MKEKNESDYEKKIKVEKITFYISILLFILLIMVIIL